MKQLKGLEENGFIDNKLFYRLKTTDSLALRFYGQSKMQKPEVPFRLLQIVAFCNAILKNT